ncbi:unnamed protein product [Phaedon cochleariae]|uniref:Major facilitator superfamily (MFS) profile domain-containing protein n=1 Tax=Phaedon cochleariae TaxID=80249 RepID=A0A9P0DMG7_PHACE|nr:unnamed protein product [Phaedon cochleariae]
MLPKKICEDVKIFNKKHHFPQILAILIAALCSLSDGILMSWTSPFILKISEDKTNYDITENQASMLTTISPVCLMITSLLFSNSCDFFGRKKILMSIALPQLLALALTAASNSFWTLCLSRVCAGIAEGFVLTVLPMYIAEISEPEVRGTWGNVATIFVLLGSLLINLAGSYCSVKTAAYIFMPVPVIFFALMFLLPDSPYFYIKVSDQKKARESLCWLRGVEEVDHILQQMNNELDQQVAEAGSWCDLLRLPNNRKALTAGLFLRFSQQFGGSTTIVVYVKYIFEKFEIDLGAEVPTLIFSCLSIVLVTVSASIVERVGRRKTYMFSLLTSGLVLLMIAAYLIVKETVVSVDVSSLEWFPAALLILYLICTSFGISNVPTLMTGEIFSSSIKAKGISVLALSYGFSVFLTSIIFHFLNSEVGLFCPFLFFAIVNLVSFFLSSRIVPETKGKTLEQIQDDLRS